MPSFNGGIMSDEFYPSFAIEPSVGFRVFFFLCLIPYHLAMVR